MLSFATIGAPEGKTLDLFGLTPNIHTAGPWLVEAAATLVGIAWLRLEARRFQAAWNAVMTGLAPAGER